MSAAKAKDTLLTDTSLPEGFVKIEQVMFHSAVMIAGKTETTLSKTRLPTLTEMGWDPTGTFIRVLYKDLKGKAHTMQFHGSVAKQTILV